MKVVLAQNVSLGRHLALSTYLRGIAKYLALRKDVQLYLAIQGPPVRIDELEPGRIRCLEADTYSLRGNAVYAWRLYRTLCELHDAVGFDLVHCLYPNSSLQAAALFKHTRAPEVKTVYDLRSPWIEASVERLSLGIEASLYRKLAYATESLLGKRVDGYIFITRGLKDFYEDKLGRSMEPSRIVPSGVDLELFFPRDPEPVRKKLGIEEDDVVIGYVGVLSVERELEFALRALRELRDRDRRYRFMFVGDGDGSARLRRTALELGLGDGAIFTGRIGFNEVPDYISACDFGLCHLPDIPFFRHSFPMKVLEYAACGVPVLASRIPAHEEIAARLPLVLYSNSSPSSLAEAILDSTARTFPGVEKVREFGWEGIASRLVAVYRDVMGT